MHNGVEKLARDVEILAAMSGDMAAYLDSEVLFWNMGRSGMPMLTLGGYLMRERRLRALSGLLTAGQQTETDAAITRFNETLAERVVRFEKKAHQELDARLRQWEAYLRDVEAETADHTSNYDTSVETRAMIEALIDRLKMPPYQPESRPLQRLAVLDERHRSRWIKGDFVWPVEWAPAYPEREYWWLYGKFRPKK